MAQAYPYEYKGEQRTKQDKCKTSMPLDKPRIWLDFNELCAADEHSGAPIYLFSQGDIVNDSYGNDVELHEGMAVSLFDDDLDDQGRPDAILAEGVVIRSFLNSDPRVKWLVRLTERQTEYAGDEKYVYWMSDL